MIALQLSEDRISLTERRNQIISALHALPSMIKKILELDQTIQQLATTVAQNKSLLLMGRGYQCVFSVIDLSTSSFLTWYVPRHATCLEGALKIKEISYMHSEGSSVP